MLSIARLHASLCYADPVNAYILRFDVQGAPSGPLAGLTLAVKDLFDVRAASAASAQLPAPVLVYKDSNVN
jgi:Asp-tRNA(Asn)/Glu-tRNA(Gln) amidotransferase A subunit family amidase